MRFPTLLNNRDNETKSSEADNSAPSNRRSFLKTLGVVGAGLALAPKDVFTSVASAARSNPNPATSSALFLVGSEDFRARVKRFVTVVANGDLALIRRLHYELDRSGMDWASDYSDFHHDYAPPFVFDRKIDLAEVICGNGFLVDLFPYYGVDCTCPSDFDMNSAEMSRVTNTGEMEFYGCVLAPAGARKRPGSADHSDYSDLLRNTYTKHQPEDWSLKYKRRLVSIKNGKHYMSYGIEHNTRTDGLNKPPMDVLITPNEV